MRRKPALQPIMHRTKSGIILPGDAPNAKRVNASSGAFPAELLDVEGLLGLFVAECVRSAPERRQPVYALATGIALVGAIAGRRYRSKTDLRTNVYTVVLGQSSSGKNHSQRVASRLLIDADLEKYIASDFVSGAGLISDLTEFPARLSVIDEFGPWLADLTAKNAPAYLRQIKTTLMRLFSCAGSKTPGKGHSDRELRKRVDIEQPHLCLVGLGTPEAFFHALQSGALKDGFIPRFLVFRPDAYIPPLVTDPKMLEISDAMIREAQLIAGTSPELGDLAPLFTMHSNVGIDPMLVPYTDDGWTEHLRYLVEVRETTLQEGCLDYSSPELVGKWSEHAIKLGMIRAISRNPQSPEMDKVCVAWGWSVAEWCIRTISDMAERHMADNETEAAHKQVKEIIANAGPSGITKSDLCRATRSLDVKRRDQIILGLVQANEIEIEKQPPGQHGGPPGYRYRKAG